MGKEPDLPTLGRLLVPAIRKHTGKFIWLANVHNGYVTQIVGKITKVSGHNIWIEDEAGEPRVHWLPDWEHQELLVTTPKNWKGLP